MKRCFAILSDICEINPPARIKLSREDLCSFVPMESVDDFSGRIERTYVRPIREVAKGYTPFAEDDVIVAKITPCMEKGKAAIARNLRNGIGFGSTEFHVLRKTDAVISEWLYYFWRYPATRINAEKTMRGSAGQKRVPADYLESLEIPLPTLAEQKRIAAILERADRLRRLRRYGLEMADNLLTAAFLRLFVENGRNYPTYAVEELAAQRRGSIRTGPFGSQLLHSEFTAAGVAVLGIDNVVQNRFAWDQRRFITREKYESLKRYTVAPGDVLISIMGTCGRCAIVPDNIPTAINTKHLCCVTLDGSKCLPTYLQASFLHHPAVLKSLGVSEKGAIMPGLNMEIIKAVAIPLPPLDAQRQFAVVVNQSEQFTNIHRESLRQAEHLFQTLLQRAFTSGL